MLFRSQDTNKGFNPYIHVEIVPIAIVDQKAVSLNSNYATARFRLVGWSAIEAVLSSREARLQKAADLLGLEDDHKGFRCPEGRKESCGPLRILLSKQFQLGDGRHDYSIPLGWKISCQARAFISDQLRPRQAEGTDPQDRSIPCEKALNIARKASEAPSTNFTELVHSLRQDVLRETK